MRPDLMALRRRDENWGSCADRLGEDARFEGKPLQSCPFPDGPLKKRWREMWHHVDDALSEAHLRD